MVCMNTSRPTLLPEKNFLIFSIYLGSIETTISCAHFSIEMEKMVHIKNIIKVDIGFYMK